MGRTAAVPAVARIYRVRIETLTGFALKIADDTRSLNRRQTLADIIIECSLSIAG